ncbi:lys-63-specific deubiquitinase BRCC36 [Lingula anatina]|uniref:Lys-63-specific deubiquitinase BRCC36 n=1 Tax=Lingula anatina TaxID=7574 RepID=A0A1S3JY54_LINAN|nr:lys-63-specific deubiquitinase BRCC36 [Lingula anatina]|eukprot:XP_013415313.1 lys-63-specific deubiquitinase BRCC36 [Lingula anatina]
MAVTAVHLDSDAFMVCLAHALSTEREEVMGLLMGETCTYGCVFISVIQYMLYIFILNCYYRLAHELQRPIRVLGWYHSHPHITVWPSHVDVRTQAMYQMLDEGFIGLIFSVFNEEKNTKSNRVQLCCFQSINQSPEGEAPQYLKLEIPVHVVQTHTLGKACLQSLVELPHILSQEEEESYGKTLTIDNLDLLTKIHNSAVYTKSLCRIMDVMSGPLIQTLEAQLERNKTKIIQLQNEKESLLQKLNRKSRSPHSPSKVTSV